ITQFSVTRFKLASGPRYVLFHRRKFRFCCIQFLVRQPRRLRAAEARPNEFCSLFRKPRSSRRDIGGARFQVGRSRVERVEIGELFQEIAIGSLAFLNTPFYGGQFALADANVAFRLVTFLEKWLFFSLQLCNRLSLFARSLLPFFFDLFYSFFDPCDSKCDFLLFLLQLFLSDDFIVYL